MKAIFMNLSSKQVSIIAISAAIYTIFFFLSGLVTVPNFTILYLPIVLLGVFPIWFGLSGLVGSMIGAFVGGAFVEGLGFLGIFEAVTALIIYSLVWLLMPQNVTEIKSKRNIIALIGVYAISLFAGTGYLLWQYTVLPIIFTAESATAILVPTFALNLAIEIIVCPVLFRTVSPRLKAWGVYSGTFTKWRTRRVKA